MRLASAAGHFDRQVLTDAYGPIIPAGTWRLDTAEFTLDYSQATLDGFIGAPTFIVGQLDLYDDGKRDSVAVGRRILSVAPNMPMVVRSALRLGDYVFIVGSGNPDYFRQEVIRRKYILQTATGLASVRSFGQYLSLAPGLSAYTATEWIKTAREVSQSSELFDEMNGIFALTELLPDVGIVEVSGLTYLMRESHVTPAGFQAASLEEIKAPARESGSFISRVYDPVLDAWTGTTTPVGFLRLRWQSHFKYLSRRTLRYEAGDDVLVCLKTAATPVAGDRITLPDGVWQVLTVQPENDCWSIHVRLIPV